MRPPGVRPLTTQALQHASALHRQAHKAGKLGRRVTLSAKKAERIAKLLANLVRKVEQG